MEHIKTGILNIIKNYKRPLTIASYSIKYSRHLIIYSDSHNTVFNIKDFNILIKILNNQNLFIYYDLCNHLKHKIIDNFGYIVGKTHPVLEGYSNILKSTINDLTNFNIENIEKIEKLYIVNKDLERTICELDNINEHFQEKIIKLTDTNDMLRSSQNDSNNINNIKTTKIIKLKNKNKLLKIQNSKITEHNTTLINVVSNKDAIINVLKDDLIKSQNDKNILYQNLETIRNLLSNNGDKKII